MTRRIVRIYLAISLMHMAALPSFSQLLVQELGADCHIRKIDPGKPLNEAEPGSSQAPEAGGDWIEAGEMPAMVHDILLQNSLIVDPWKPGRVEEYQWIAEHDWLYSMLFELDETEGEAILRFGGLDGIVDIYLNGKRIGSHSNMYLPLELDVTGKLRHKNRLVLHFRSIFEKIGEERTQIRHVDGDPGRPVRRTSHNYYNYLGPWPMWSRVGVFEDIQLLRTGGHRLEEVFARSSLEETLEKGVVRVNFAGSTTGDEVRIRVSLKDEVNREVVAVIQKEEAEKGGFEGAIILDVEKPALWWPRGYGEQPLYTLSTELIIDGTSHQSVDKILGFRHVAMEDTFHFVVNHIPVKLWGGCWVTPDLMTVVWNQEKAEKLLQMAANANFNAFRIWGEVECPDEQFYETADRMGFLIWQDFTDLPIGDSEKDMEICLEEGAYLLKKLMNHPSVLLWCGGNEQAWRNYRQFSSPRDSLEPWNGIPATEKLYRLTKELDPDRLFVPNSPYHGFDPNDPAVGSTHGYTNVFFVPGYDYLNFASEDTRIAAPVLHSLKMFMDPADLWPDDFDPAFYKGEIYPFPEQWMKYSTFSAWRKTGPMEQFYDARDLASLVHYMGMAEAHYYRDVIERQRRGRPVSDQLGKRRCGGYLVWKYNDSWPQVYSAKVDYFLEPYHAYYTLKRSYQPVMLSFDMSSYITLWAINDSKEPVRGEVTLRFYNLTNNQLSKEISKQVEIAPGSSEVVMDLYREGIGRFHLQHALYAELKDEEGNILAVKHQFADIERRITFPEAKVNAEVDNGILVLTTDQYARTICLTGDSGGDQFGWFFEDNYFDIAPGEVKRVRILGSHKSGKISVKPWYSHHETTIDWKTNYTN